ncbi:MAG: hypothetical protein F6K24_20715 [Okeania sp. SIO2D1]|nr:hypothetical protein [Okeania sp. SIO2D1]
MDLDCSQLSRRRRRWSKPQRKMALLKSVYDINLNYLGVISNPVKQP